MSELARTLIFTGTSFIPRGADPVFDGGVEYPGARQ